MIQSALAVLNSISKVTRLYNNELKQSFSQDHEINLSKMSRAASDNSVNVKSSPKALCASENACSVPEGIWMPNNSGVCLLPDFL